MGERKDATLRMIDDLLEDNKRVRKELLELKARTMQKKEWEEDDSTEEEINYNSLVYANQDDARHKLAKVQKQLEQSYEERKRLSTMFVNEVERMRNIIR